MFIGLAFTKKIVYFFQSNEVLRQNERTVPPNYSQSLLFPRPNHSSATNADKTSNCTIVINEESTEVAPPSYVEALQ